MAEVSGLYLCKVKKEPRSEIEMGNFIENFGLSGDAYSESNIEKQVTVFFEEGRDSLKNEPFPGLCFPRFLETLRISGARPENFETGTKIHIGLAILEVSMPRKKCYPECKIIQDRRHCSLSSDVRFCKVISTGIIKKGDRVIIEN
jgi:MOSC domain-containing protein YiiM